ncbi:MAG: class IV adenylate cyclase, partial [Acidobacteriota bacterium]|nr:class IV adenylate cyclase [Acidobacteriota bacterium]
EDNRVYDDERGTLKTAGRLLRVRTIGSRNVLTFKRPEVGGDGSPRYKVRIEHETRIEDPEQLDEILVGLGFHVVYRYQKYRQRYTIGQQSIELDETPIGNFLELEGAPKAIDATAEKLGYSAEQYITKTYRALHCEICGLAEPGDLVFPADEAG